LPFEAVTTLYADDTRSAALEAKVEAGKKSPLGTVDVGIDGALKSITANKGKYVIFRTTDVFLLIDEMNEPVNQSALLKLKSRKGPSAIITGVAIVYDNSMAADYSKDFGVTVSAEPSVTPATASAGVQVKTSEKLIRSFSDGTVFAYEYSIIEWDEESRTAKVKNIKLERPNKFVVWWFSM
jgi:hypothetical protein